MLIIYSELTTVVILFFPNRFGNFSKPNISLRHRHLGGTQSNCAVCICDCRFLLPLLLPSDNLLIQLYTTVSFCCVSDPFFRAIYILVTLHWRDVTSGETIFVFTLLLHYFNLYCRSEDSSIKCCKKSNCLNICVSLNIFNISKRDYCYLSILR